MRLVGFSVTNYRSLLSARRLPLADSTVLLGQNNEGKSNLLSALAAAMWVVGQLGVRRLIQGRLRTSSQYRTGPFYDWARDYPISLQETNPDGESIFRLEFKLNEEERAEFRKIVKSTTNEDLPIEIKLGRRDPAFRVVKKGPGAEGLNQKQQQIAEFIGSRVEFTYIPAVRTADAALEVVKDMVERELRVLERDEAFIKLVDNISQAQLPILKAISRQIETALKAFLPQIRSVDVRAPDSSRYRALRRDVEIIVDDGTPTSLDRKGDGVQSLAAISLLRGVSSTNRDIILALEEPESHLHPGAIHRLREVLEEISRKHQTVITTHCPLFVDRSRVASNIIVSGSKARPATSVQEIRETLGVKASDNLMHATWVLVVEGLSDARILQSIFQERSAILRSSIMARHFVIDHLNGVGKLSYKLTELQNALCGVHVFLDHDDPARTAGQVAVESGLLKPVDCHYATCPGKKNSELEDLVDSGLYADRILEVYGVELRGPAFQSGKIWSERMSETFVRAGKIWSDRTKNDVKAFIADAVVSAPKTALRKELMSAIDSLISALEQKVVQGELRSNT
jgi:putative ATP-dependent endonuclease of OLD family